jgi:hypothetical protein
MPPVKKRMPTQGFSKAKIRVSPIDFMNRQKYYLTVAGVSRRQKKGIYHRPVSAQGYDPGGGRRRPQTFLSGRHGRTKCAIPPDGEIGDWVKWTSWRYVS